MLRAALTGGLCSGKSTVAAMLRERGWPVLDADAIGHRLLQPGEAAAAAVETEFGTLDRAQLAARVFADAEARRRLNAILHPPIRAEMERQLQTLEAGGAGAAFAEIALFFEEGAQGRYDLAVTVVCDREIRLRRAVRRGMTAAAAAARMATQMPDADKVRRADFVIDNSGTLKATEAQVEAMLEAICVA